MILSTENLVYARAVANGMVSALKTVPAGALLATPHVKLFVAPGTPTPDSAYADFTPPAFSGYADQALTLNGPFNSSADTQAMVGTVTFTQTGSTGATVVGYVITDGAAVYYGGEVFASPVPFANNGDFLDLTVVLPMDCFQAP